MSEPSNEQFEGIRDVGLLSFLVLAIITILAYPVVAAWKKVVG